jgi:hypothetical protein
VLDPEKRQEHLELKLWWVNPWMEQLRAIREGLFVSQSDDGVDAQRSARGDVAREQGDDTQN